MFIYFNVTFGFLNNITSKNYKIENYIVVVNKDSSSEKIEDLKNKKISYVNSEMYKMDKAIETLKKKISFESIVEEDYDLMLKKLYEENIDAIVLEQSYKDILVESSSEEDNNSLYNTFNDKTKIIYTFEIKIEETKEEEQNVNVVGEPFNIYISGIDTYGKISSVSRSDVNIVATVNPKTKQVLLTTIPRDYYVQLNGTTGYKDKLTHAGVYGVDKSLKTIEDLLDIKINYYVKVNFTSLIKMVDAVNGIDVYSKYSFKGEKYTFKAGYNHMNGEQALEFSRTRKTLAGGDRARGENQEAVIAALIDKVCSKTIITNYISILDSLDDSFVTNMEESKITDLIKMQLNDMSKWNVTSISLDGTNGYDYTYSYKNQKLYVMIPIESTITSAKSKIKAVFDGEKLDSSYEEFDGSSSTVTTKSNNTNNSKPNSTSTTNTNPSSNSSSSNETTNQPSSNEENTTNNNSTEENDNKTELNSETDNQSNNESNEQFKEPENNDSNCTMVDGECMEQHTPDA